MTVTYPRRVMLRAVNETLKRAEEAMTESRSVGSAPSNDGGPHPSLQQRPHRLQDSGGEKKRKDMNRHRRDESREHSEASTSGSGHDILTQGQATEHRDSRQFGTEISDEKPVDGTSDRQLSESNLQASAALQNSDLAWPQKQKMRIFPEDDRDTQPRASTEADKGTQPRESSVADGNTQSRRHSQADSVVTLTQAPQYTAVRTSVATPSNKQPSGKAHSLVDEIDATIAKLKSLIHVERTGAFSNAASNVESASEKQPPTAKSTGIMHVTSAAYKPANSADVQSSFFQAPPSNSRNAGQAPDIRISTQAHAGQSTSQGLKSDRAAQDSFAARAGATLCKSCQQTPAHPQKSTSMQKPIAEDAAANSENKVQTMTTEDRLRLLRHEAGSMGLQLVKSQVHAANPTTAI